MQSFLSLSRKQRRAIERKLGPDALDMIDGDGFMGRAGAVESEEIKLFNDTALSLYMQILKVSKIVVESGKSVCGDVALNASFSKFRAEIETNPSGPISTFSAQQSAQLAMLIMSNEKALLEIEDTNLLEAEFGLKRNWGKLDQEQKTLVWTKLHAMCKNVIIYSFDMLNPIKKHLPNDVQKILEKLITCVKTKIIDGFTATKAFTSKGPTDSPPDAAAAAPPVQETVVEMMEKQSEMVKKLQETMKGCRDPKQMKRMMMAQIKMFHRDFEKYDIPTSTSTTEDATAPAAAAASAEPKKEEDTFVKDVLSCFEDIVEKMDDIPIEEHEQEEEGEEEEEDE